MNYILFLISNTEKDIWENIISSLSLNKQKGVENKGHRNANNQDGIGEPQDV